VSNSPRSVRRIAKSSFEPLRTAKSAKPAERETATIPYTFLGVLGGFLFYSFATLQFACPLGAPQTTKSADKVPETLSLTHTGNQSFNSSFASH